MKVELIKGSSAKSLLASEQFCTEWSALWGQCPWVTAYQTCDFARVWYSTYCNEFSPILLTSRDSSGVLQGLLALACAPDGRQIVAGGIHAEYHSWISTPALGNAFPAAAFEVLRRELRPRPVTFKYLVPDAPTEWLSRPEIKRLTVLEPISRPVVQLGDGQALQKSLAKKHTKLRLRRLRQLGELSFTRIIHPEEFDSLFDQMTVLYDLRHGAIQGAEPFCSIPLQKVFHLALMKMPSLFHVTAMRVGDRLAAAHFGILGKKELHLGTPVHDPSLAQHSPGKLLFLLLAQMLQKEGYERIDLTPGGDAYKDVLANSTDTVHKLTILPGASQRIVVSAAEQLRATGRFACRAVGTTPARARLQLKNLPVATRILPWLARGAGDWLVSHRQDRVYSWHPRQEPMPEACNQIHRDKWEDLLSYQSPPGGPARQPFLSAALQWIEDGQHVYTCAEAGRLLHMAWVLEQSDQTPFSRWLPDLPPVANGMLVHDFRAFSRNPDWNLADLLLKRIMHDAPASSPVFIMIPGDRSGELRVVETNGFSYICSQWYSVVMGRRWHWIENPDPSAHRNADDSNLASEPRRVSRIEPAAVAQLFNPRATMPSSQPPGESHD